MTCKHQVTKNLLKPTVLIFKNMRNRLIRDGKLKSGVAPSYFIEGMLHNVPADQFGGGYQNTADKCWGWINSANAAELKCANGIHPLVRDNTATPWDTKGFIDFLQETQRLGLTW